MVAEKKKKYDYFQNLHLERYTPEERRAQCALGGKRSQATTRKKKAMREVARTILDMELKTEDEFRAELEARGVVQTEAAAVLLAQLIRARTGDTEAARFLRDTSGQKPVDNVAIGNMEDKPFATLDLSTLSDDQLKELLEGAGDEEVAEED